MKKKRTSRAGTGRAGFTLIELMVSMIVMAIGLVGIIHMQVVTVRGNSYAMERTEALRIAQGVIGDLRARGIEWVNLHTTEKTFDEVFNNEIQLATVAEPSTGANMVKDDLKPQQSYGGNTGIAAGADALTDAQLLNVRAEVDGLGAVYRVHYAAHPVYLEPSDTTPSTDVVRVTVFVSWDNKDHGEEYAWSSWSNDDVFWKRHMVTATAYLHRQRFW